MKYTVTVNAQGNFTIVEANKIPYSKGTTAVKAQRLLKELQNDE